MFEFKNIFDEEIKRIDYFKHFHTLNKKIFLTNSKFFKKENQITTINI